METENIEEVNDKEIVSSGNNSQRTLHFLLLILCFALCLLFFYKILF
jgi:hypothetical protein